MCLSKDVTGHCSFCCIALPRSCFTVLLGSALSFLICFWTSSHDFLYSVSVQRRGRRSVSCFILRKTSFCILLHFFWFHSVSVQRRDRCSVTYPTHPFLFPTSLPFFFENLFVWLLSLLPRFLVWVVSLNVTGVSVQRRGRYAPPSQSYPPLLLFVYPVIPSAHPVLNPR